MPYRICTRCVMDTSDPEIVFDDDGCCNHCSRAIRDMESGWLRGPAGEAALGRLAAELRSSRGRHHGILGLSGGLDSSYLAYRLAELGLKPLVVHVDAGWNSEIAVRNIHALVSKLELELVTDVVPWFEMRDVQLAYLRAGVANQDTPQDHALFAALYRFAVRHRVRHVISGSNLATESILPSSWGYTPMDGRQVKAIHRAYGSAPLRHFPVLTLRRYQVQYRALHRMRVVRPLNYIDYAKDLARATLQREVGWRDYGGKHEESRWTKLFQGYYLPTYFGIDKRRAHLSSLIVAGQGTREEALEQLQSPAMRSEDVAVEKDYIARKLGITLDELESLLNVPKRSHREFPNDERFLQLSLPRNLKRLLPA